MIYNGKPAVSESIYGSSPAELNQKIIEGNLQGGTSQ